MKKIVFLFMSIFMLNSIYAQTYTIVSRNNPDTIKLYQNALGKAIKSVTSMIPGTNDDGPYYYLIKKVHNGKESLLFVELSKDEKKIITSYETDMVTPGKWSTKIYTLLDVYTQMKRENAIYLHGKIIGIDVEMHQRPNNFQDIIIIDGIEFASPLKFFMLDESIRQAARQKAQMEQSKAQQLFEPQDLPGVEPDANDYYIAYLISSKQFNKEQDRAIINELCHPGLIQDIAEKFDTFVLKASAKGHDPRLDVYAK